MNYAATEFWVNALISITYTTLLFWWTYNVSGGDIALIALFFSLAFIQFVVLLISKRLTLASCAGLLFTVVLFIVIFQVIEYNRSQIKPSLNYMDM